MFIHRQNVLLLEQKPTVNTMSQLAKVIELHN